MLSDAPALRDAAQSKARDDPIAATLRVARLLISVSVRRKSTLDLLTPAHTWSSESVHHDRLPLLQRAVMFVSVVGPFLGLIAAIVLLWQRHFIGWPEMFVMAVMYAFCGFGVTIGFHRLLTHRAFE